MRRTLAAIASLFLATYASAQGVGRVVYYGPPSALCEALTPSADASTSNWVPLGAGTHWSEVDDPTKITCEMVDDGDTSYVRCPKASTCTDVFDLSNCTSCSSYTILYVVLEISAKKCNGSSTGNPSATVYLVVGGVDYSAGTKQVFSSADYSKSTLATSFYANPATGVPWSASDIDALQIKVTRASGGNWDYCMSAVRAIVVYEASPFSTTPTEVGGD